jgi:hypothetical protein
VAISQESTPAAVGTAVNLVVQVSNNTPNALDKVILTAELDSKLEHSSGAAILTLEVASLKPAETRKLHLTATPKDSGSFPVRVGAEAGKLKNEAKFVVAVQGQYGVAVPVTSPPPLTAVFASQPSRQFTINPKTPVENLLPTPPRFRQPTVLILGLFKDELARVPEVSFQEPISRGVSVDKAREQTAQMLAKINFVNQKERDGFLKTLVSKRADLNGLPFAMGEACRQTQERGKQFAQALGTLRQALQAVAGNNNPTETADNFWQQYQTSCLQEDKANAHCDAAHREHVALARISALMQVLAPETVAMRTGLARYLATLSHTEATRALAKLAIFAPESDVRQAALDGLKVRRDADYTEVLLQGLRYPLPSVAQHAAGDIVTLNRKDLVPRLVDFLAEPDPRLPVAIDKTASVSSTSSPAGKKTIVREVVRINHHRNCLMCHTPGSDVASAPLSTPAASAPVVTAAVPIPGEPLPTFGTGYQSSTPDIVVRVDVTYLRQDFSVMQRVAEAHPWPEMQRFDFLVRTRDVTEEEALAVRDRLGQKEAGVLSPYHRAVVTALRELTGRDTEPTAEAWRRLLKLETN